MPYSQPPALFEQDDSEYQSLPRSTLEWPPTTNPTPRSPDEALLSLLNSKRYSDAHALLGEFQATDQPVRPRIAFAKHADAVFATARQTPDSQPDTSWLDWWKLTPSVNYLDQNGATNPMQQLRRIRKHATDILDQWIIQPDKDWDALVSYAVVLVQQGHFATVNNRLIVYLAAYAPPSASERLYVETLAALQAQWQACLEKGNAVSKTALSQTRLLKEEQLLERRRERVLLAHVTFGRLGLAVDLLEQTCQLGLVSRQTRGLRKKSFLAVLAVLANADEFDLFRRTYDLMTAAGYRLVRLLSREWKHPLPYVIRSRHYSSTDMAPTAQEAFATWRYAHHSSDLEEGPLLAEEPESLGGETAERPADVTPAYKGQPYDFEQASRELVQRIAEGVMPNRASVAQWILHARDSSHGRLLSMVNQTLDSRSETPKWIRRHWLASRIMANVWCREFTAALDIVKSRFDLSGLPVEFQQAITTLAPAQDRKRDDLLAMNASVFELTTHALIKAIENGAGSSQAQASAVIDTLLNSLLSSTMSFVPRKPYPTHAVSYDLRTQSLFDSHAFTPFVQSMLQRSPESSAQSIVDVLLDTQQTFQLAPTKHQFGILLAALARQPGLEADVVWLLDKLERSQSTVESVGYDHGFPNLRGLDELTVSDKINVRPDIVAYTSIVVMFSMRKQFQLANEIVRRVEDRRTKDGLVVDDKWLQVVARVRSDMLKTL
ncbi:hypothetical protein OIV83_002091 [Microbotryomycetes sp. JL201]|nr:hypothetical protein OIV83_002091 [Microbotryomycetes sp. JL201]